MNLAGIKTIIELSERIDRLEDENAELKESLAKARVASRRGGELVHVPRSTALVAWSRGARRERG